MLNRLLRLFRKPAAVPAPAPAPSARHAAVPSWQSLRGPELESDRSLIADAQRWLALLPEFARPKALCAAHPRVANRLALLWADRPAIRLYFDTLLIDKRAGRVGFSTEVRAELLQLRVFHESGMRDSAAVRDWKLRFAQARKQAAEPPRASESDADPAKPG